MARKKTTASKADDTASIEPEGNEGPHGKISKSEAVRRALADGVDQPADGVAYIKSHFGLEMNPQHFSAVKSTHLKKQGGGIKVAVKRGRKPKVAAEGYVAPSQKATGGGAADLIAALEALKPLVAAMGVDKVKRLTDLLG